MAVRLHRIRKRSGEELVEDFALGRVGRGGGCRLAAPKSYRAAESSEKWLWERRTHEEWVTLWVFIAALESSPASSTQPSRCGSCFTPPNDGLAAPCSPGLRRGPARRWGSVSGAGTKAARPAAGLRFLWGALLVTYGNFGGSPEWFRLHLLDQKMGKKGGCGGELKVPWLVFWC